jgi:uncharacterized protein (DUF305 family)
VSSVTDDHLQHLAPGAPDPPGGDVDDEVVVLPWYRNPLTIASLLVGLLLLAGAIGYVVGNNRAIPDPNATDIGFLQDMRVHHEQAVQMSWIFLDEPGTDRSLRTVAREIVVGQEIEVGRMIQLLRTFGESEVNETDVAMAWMGHPMPLQEMPGLASEADIDRLVAAEAGEADAVFVELMTEHHRAGVEMAEHARDHAATGEVRLMATQIATGQAAEIEELELLLARSRS